MTRDIRLPGTGDRDIDEHLSCERESHREADRLREDRIDEFAPVDLEQVRADLELLSELAFMPAEDTE